MEYLRAEVGEVGHGEDEHGLEDGGVVGEPGDKASDVAPDDANDCSTASHHDKAGETLEDVSGLNVLLLNLHIGLKHVVEDNSHRVIEQGLSEHNNVQDLVNLDLLKDGEDSHRVHGGDEGGEEEGLEQTGRVVFTIDASLATTPQSQSYSHWDY